MPWTRPRYLWEDKDRHGNIRLYVKRPGKPKIRILAETGTQTFWDAYALALKGIAVVTEAKPAPLPVAEAGTFRWLVEQYKNGSEFRALGVTTRGARTDLLESALNEPVQPGSPLLMGDIPLASFTSVHVRGLRDRKRDVPEGANNRLKAIRGVFKWAMDQDELVKRYKLTINPARDVPRLKNRSDGFHTWTEDEVAIYEAHHPIGTPARLFLALLLFTGQRRGDVIRFGRQHVRKEYNPKTKRTDHWLYFTQRKNRENKPVTLALPMLDVLRDIIDRTKCGDLNFLASAQGKAYTDAGIGNRMRKWCNVAGLPHCTAHGLRKAGACIAVENGATEKQLNAIFGWTDPKQAAHYTRKANQKRLAADSMHMISRRGPKPDAGAPLLDWAGQNTPTDFEVQKGG